MYICVHELRGTKGGREGGRERGREREHLGLIGLMLQLTRGLCSLRKETGLVETLRIVELVVMYLWMQLHQLLIATHTHTHTHTYTHTHTHTHTHRE